MTIEFVPTTETEAIALDGCKVRATWADGSTTIRTVEVTDMGNQCIRVDLVRRNHGTRYDGNARLDVIA